MLSFSRAKITRFEEKAVERIDKSSEPIIALTKGATMKTDENLNIPDADGDLPLVDAALFGASSKLVRSLSERGADVFARDETGLNAADAAFLNERGSLSVLKAVLKSVPLTAAQRLRLAVCTAKRPFKKDSAVFREIKALKSRPADERAKGKSTLLMDAVRFHRPRGVLKQLIAAGCDVNARDDDGWTALRFAGEDFKTAKFLIKHGADVNTADNDGDTCAQDWGGSVRFIRLFLKNGANDFIKNKMWDELTVLICTKNKPSIKAFSLLLNAGVDIDRRTERGGRIALHEAVKYGGLPLIKFLIRRGANVNAIDAFGGTPLIACGFETAGCSARKVARLLIKAGADPHLKRQIGKKNVCFTDMIRNVPYFEKIAEYCEKQRKE